MAHYKIRLFYFIYIYRFLSLDCLIVKVCSYKSCLSSLEIVQKLKTNLNLHCCYLHSLFSSVRVIVRLFFLSTMYIFKNYYNFSSILSLYLFLETQYLKLWMELHLYFWHHKSKEKDCYLFLLEVFMQCSMIVSLFSFSPLFFLNSNCMTSHLVHKLLSPKPLLQKWSLPVLNLCTWLFLLRALPLCILNHNLLLYFQEHLTTSSVFSED